MKFLLLLAAGVFLSACAPQRSELTPGGVIDPATAVAPILYSPVTAGIVDYQPVEPRPWGAQNESMP